MIGAAFKIGNDAARLAYEERASFELNREEARKNSAVETAASHPSKIKRRDAG